MAKTDPTFFDNLNQEIMDKAMVAKYLKVSMKTVERMVARGEIPYFYLSSAKLLRFRLSSIRERLAFKEQGA